MSQRNFLQQDTLEGDVRMQVCNLEFSCFFVYFTRRCVLFVSIGNNVKLSEHSEASLDALTKYQSQSASGGLLDTYTGFHKDTRVPILS